ncbi:MAG: hypothetical protein FGM53_03620 [Rhodocyclaceae bacterium]|nr:hypothetical protein [Rhodocyclaceae bacterium]
MNSMYTDVEHAFLCDYFGVERPRSLINIDTYDQSAGDGVALLNESSYPGVNLASGVARLALSRLEVLGRGWVEENRSAHELTSGFVRDGYDGLYDIDLYPLYLFGVDWAIPSDYDHFPEYYYLTWFPEFDRYVVTASVSSKERYGVSDFAIGWNSASNKRIDLCHHIIGTYWEDVHKPFNGYGWGKVLSSGLVPEHLASEWRSELWPLSTEYGPIVGSMLAGEQGAQHVH